MWAAEGLMLYVHFLEDDSHSLMNRISIVMEIKSFMEVDDSIEEREA